MLTIEKCHSNVRARTALGSRAAGATVHAATPHLAPRQLEVWCNGTLCCALREERKIGFKTRSRTTVHSLCDCCSRVTDFYIRKGINVKYVVTEATKLQQLSAGARAGDVKKLAAYLQGSLHMRYRYRLALDKNQLSRGLVANLFSWVPVNGGNFLVFLYIGMKKLNLLIAIAQLFILQVLYPLSYLFHTIKTSEKAATLRST